MRRVVFGVLFGVTFSCIPYVAAQEPAAPTFKARTDIVQLYINVFDGHGDAVPQLSKENFLVFEDGRAQEITFFTNEDVPVAAGLVIDNSTSMITRRNLVEAGAMAFADSSHPEDELFAILFNEHVRRGLPDTLAFTSSRPLLRGLLGSLRPAGKTALHDAVIAALDHVERATHQKHMIIVLSDGEDNASSHDRAAMFERAKQSDSIIYTISTNDPRRGGDGNPGVLRRLAEIGGGLAYFPDTNQETVAAFTEIAQNIRRGYSLGYAPTNAAQDGKWRNVKVMVRAPGRRLSARCRDGYTAPGSSSTR